MHRLTFIVSLLVLSNTFQIKNINHDISIQTASEYVQYVQTLNGLATENDLKNNPQLNQIVQDQRPSLLNPQSDIVLALLDQVKLNNQNLPTVHDLNLLNQLDFLINGFKIEDLADLQPEEILQKVQKIKSTGKIVHTLEVSSQLIQQFQFHAARKLEQKDSEESSEEESSESVKQNHENTVHKQQTVRVKTSKANPTYILKFFFGLMFIIVSLGSLMAIANMQNKKDTLLYAKFIADVGAR